MLKKIHIQNYKSIYDLELDLGRVNVLIGENGCGKTNILEAIAFGGAALENKLDSEFLFNRGIRVTEPELMKSLFYLNQANRHIQLQLSNIENDQIEIFGREESNKMRAYFKNETISKIALGSGIETIDLPDNEIEIIDQLNSLLSLKKKFFQNFLIYCPENTPLRNFQDEGAIQPLGIKGEGVFKHLVYLFEHKKDLVEKIKDNLQLLGWFDTFEIPKGLMFGEKRIEIQDRYISKIQPKTRNRKKNPLAYFDQRSANEGFLYLLFYFTLFVSDKTPAFFAIDNIDNALNPKLCQKLMEVLAILAKEHNKQVILTTHNPAILDGLDLKDDDQRLFVVSRNKLGHTMVLREEYTPIPENQRVVRLSEQFSRGYIGGLPKNF